MRNLLTGLLALGMVGCVTSSPSPPAIAKPRVVVTTDPELDDANSLLRYLLYSADFETEGLIYASSGVHWKGDGTGAKRLVPGREYTRFGLNLCPCASWRWSQDERFIHDAVEAYAQAYPNLRVHDADYPAPALLQSKIRWGNIEFDGDISKNSDGSELIAGLLLDDRPGPLYLLAWGGGSTIARALKSIEDQYAATPRWPTIREKVSRKAIIQSFGDQDGAYAAYIRPNWPQIEFRQMSTQTYGYGARNAVLPQDQVYLSAAWTRENVTARGAMGALYRVWGDGKQMVKDDIFDHFGFAGLTGEQLKARGYVVWTPVQEQGSWISEGDTSTFLNLVGNGLRGHEHVDYGGWGGRSGRDSGPDGPNEHYASARFFGAAQRDFAARLKWAVTPSFAGANHAPRVVLDGPLDRTISKRTSQPLSFRAADADGDPVAVRVWQYAEAGTGRSAVIVANGRTAGPPMISAAPDAQPGDTVHLIVEATDNGVPALTSYQRVIYRVTD